MAKSLQRALRVVVKGPVLLEHLNNQLATRVAPSSTTLRWHRLPLYMAYNLILADAADQRLRGGGLVRWGTVDASPQGGIDWVMTGGRTVAVDQLIDAFRAANMLWNSVVPMEQQQEAMLSLTKLLELERGHPTGCES